MKGGPIMDIERREFIMLTKSYESIYGSKNFVDIISLTVRK